MTARQSLHVARSVQTNLPNANINIRRLKMATQAREEKVTPIDGNDGIWTWEIVQIDDREDTNESMPGWYASYQLWDAENDRPGDYSAVCGPCENEREAHNEALDLYKRR
jgi:hypothetical protein